MEDRFKRLPILKSMNINVIQEKEIGFYVKLFTCGWCLSPLFMVSVFFFLLLLILIEDKFIFRMESQDSQDWIVKEVLEITWNEEVWSDLHLNDLHLDVKGQVAHLCPATQKLTQEGTDGSKIYILDPHPPKTYKWAY